MPTSEFLSPDSGETGFGVWREKLAVPLLKTLGAGKKFLIGEDQDPLIRPDTEDRRPSRKDKKFPLSPTTSSTPFRVSSSLAAPGSAESDASPASGTSTVPVLPHTPGLNTDDNESPPPLIGINTGPFVFEHDGPDDLTSHLPVSGAC
jgi:hypothetical protein